MMLCLECIPVVVVAAAAAAVVMMMTVEKKRARGSEGEMYLHTRKSGCQGLPTNRIISLDGFPALPCLEVPVPPDHGILALAAASTRDEMACNRR